MKELNGGPEGLHFVLGRKIKDRFEWEDLKPLADQYVRQTRELIGTIPSLGHPRSWQELTRQYTLNAELLQNAIEEKDSANLRERFQELHRSCRGCHDKHR